MDVTTKPKTKTGRADRDTFLADAVKPKVRHITYSDGFRFGIGLICAQLLVALLFGGIAWLLTATLHLHF